MPEEALDATHNPCAISTLYRLVRKEHDALKSISATSTEACSRHSTHSASKVPGSIERSTCARSLFSDVSTLTPSSNNLPPARQLNANLTVMEERKRRMLAGSKKHSTYDVSCEQLPTYQFEKFMDSLGVEFSFFLFCCASLMTIPVLHACPKPLFENDTAVVPSVAAGGGSPGASPSGANASAVAPTTTTTTSDTQQV